MRGPSIPRRVPFRNRSPCGKVDLHKKNAADFFGGILPEQSQRELVARNLGISARNDFAMLEKIGGECAGAVTFMPAGQALPESPARYRDLSDADLVSVLKTLPRRPLLAGDDEVRLSLAGAQDKIAVKVSGTQISIPLENAPSTHILKPSGERFVGVPANEVLCLRLASAVGIPAAAGEVRTIHEWITHGLNAMTAHPLKRLRDCSTSGCIKRTSARH